MERLTFEKWEDERFQNDTYFIELDEGTARILNPWAIHRVVAGKAIDKFAEYENAEEDGRLLVLPCKVGDTVYELCDGFVEECTVETIYIADYTDREGKSSYMAEIHYDREDCPYVSEEIYFSDIGKTVFLTQEAAEQALKERKE